VTQRAKQAQIVGVVGLVIVAVVATTLWLPRQRNSVTRQEGQIYLSEVNYHDISGLDTHDFLEIHNSGTSDVALTDWCISGVDFCFDDTTLLASGATLVVTGQLFEGKLSNSDEVIELRDSLDNLVDQVRYSSEATWTYLSDGRGHSLHRMKPLSEESTEAESEDGEVAFREFNQSNWSSDVPSPGSVYSPSFRNDIRKDASVVMSEIHFHPTNDNPAEEFVELANVSTTKVELTDWCIQELGVCFDAGDSLESGQVLVVPSSRWTSSLRNSEGVLRLLSKTQELQDVVRYEDNDLWPAYADGYGLSLQRRNALLWGTEPGNWEALTPSPGTYVSSANARYLPMFSDVEVTQSPSASEPVEIRASLRDGKDAMLHYRVNFENDVSVPLVQQGDDTWTGIIPKHPDGTLIRYRLTASGVDTDGSWPRAGDGMVYRGTVVVSTADTLLPRLQWFVEDEYYNQIYNDRDLYGDNGYPTVLAFDGEVFDGALMRIRGNQSRLNQKRKWKIVLPPGYETTLGDRLARPVNEFALNSAVTDKSFVREILTSELQQMGGGIGQQVFPLRFERNNTFYGLYLYQEQPDGRWRQRWGFSEQAVAFKADRQATLNVNQLDLPDSEMRQRYQRRTQRWLDHTDEIRELIRQVNNQNQEELMSFIYRHLDIPQIVEAIATMRVAQHLEWEHKNHVLIFDPADEKWRLIPIDFDLNFGRQYVSGCNSLCEDVSASGYMEYMEGNRLGRLFLKMPELRQMLDRRTRTLAEVFLAEGYLEKRIAEWDQMMSGDAAKDRKIWYTYGEQQSIQRGQQLLLQRYVVEKRELFLGPNSQQRLPATQPTSPSFSLSESGPVIITNNDVVAIDISGVQLPKQKAKVPAGTVLVPGQSAVFETERQPVGPTDTRQMHIWVTSP
jgi:spore coat protein CotH